MSSLLRSPRGTSDYFGKDQELRHYIRKILESAFERYGYQEAETPILNHYETLAQKYAGGAEILKEIYRLQDQGQRELALRYDLTIPFARLVGQNKQSSFRRYEIGKVFRDGPIKAGRLREFTQADVDVVGVKSLMAEAELMMMILDVFYYLSIKVEIQYNNRKLLEDVLKRAGVEESQLGDTILSLDKIEKIGQPAVAAELLEKGLESNVIEQLFTDMNNIQENGLDAGFIEGEGGKELKELQTYIKALGMEYQTRFTPYLARGLDIYTGTVLEVFLKESAINSSVASGGRYDNIIGSFLGDKGQEYPAVGISFGLDVIYQALVEKGEDAEEKIDVFIIPLETPVESLELARSLRMQDYKVLLEMKRSLRKSLDYANKMGIPWVIVLGREEIENNIVKIKNMTTGTEWKVPRWDLAYNAFRYLRESYREPEEQIVKAIYAQGTSVIIEFDSLIIDMPSGCKVPIRDVEYHGTGLVCFTVNGKTDFFSIIDAVFGEAPYYRPRNYKIIEGDKDTLIRYVKMMEDE